MDTPPRQVEDPGEKHQCLPVLVFALPTSMSLAPRRRPFCR